MKIQVIKSGINGEGIGYFKEKPIFISGVLPLESVEVKRFEDKGKYMISLDHYVLENSPLRIKPKCKHQRLCGGCPLMITDIQTQTQMKLENFKQALHKYAGVQLTKLVGDVVVNPEPFGYRNSLKMPIQMIEGRLCTGFYQSASNHFVEIERCEVHNDLLEKTRVSVLEVLNTFKLKAYDEQTKKGMRMLVMRTLSNKTQISLITGEDVLTHALVEALASIESVVSIYQSVHTAKKTVELFGEEATLLFGERYLKFEFASLKMELLPQAFFQLNVHSAENLFNTVLEHIHPKDEVIDVYCGVGALSLMMAKKASSVYGIELNKEAIKSARFNADNNKLKNVRFQTADAFVELQKHNLRNHTIVVDPPRSGLSDDMVKLLIQYPAQKLIYVSCNPSTLAKNLKELQKVYRVESIQSFDFFSQTPLLEAVVVLKPAKSNRASLAQPQSRPHRTPR